MIASLLVSLAAVQAPSMQHEAPELYVEGEPYMVKVEIRMPREAVVPIPSWWVTPSAFVFNGRPLGDRNDEELLSLEPGCKLTAEFDLSAALEKELDGGLRDFRLNFGKANVEPTGVRAFQAAENGIDFMTLPLQQLANYQVVLRTNRGVIWMTLWPDLAPNHVRNFLDLCYTGFYDGTTFHRVVPSFMIQGGRAKTGSEAPRNVQAEFSDRKHVAGVVSMARTDGDINSATSEFFIVHAASPHLDGQYSAFGEVLWGMDVVDRIAHSGDKAFRLSDPRSHKPPDDQIIEKAVVVKAKTAPAVQQD